MNATPEAALLISLHDVCPSSWPAYKPLVAELDRMPDVRLTHLLVPDFHGQGRVDEDTEFCRAMDQRLARGDELVLHGLRHQDEGPAPTSPGQYLQRRVLTHEGEFASLSRQEASDRIEQGLELFRRLDWPVKGFVAPGWLTNAAARRAIAAAGFRYTTDKTAIYALPDWQAWPLPTLVMSSRSIWRRVLFEGVNRLKRERVRAAPLVRLALHPVDMRYSGPMQFWLDSIRILAAERRALTKGQWLALASEVPA